MNIRGIIASAAVLALSVQASFGAVVIDSCWPAPDYESLDAMLLSEELALGVYAYDDEDDWAELTYSWSFDYDDGSGVVDHYDLDDDGYEIVFEPANANRFPGAGTYVFACEVGVGTTNATASQIWQITVVEDPTSVEVATVTQLQHALEGVKYGTGPTEIHVAAGTYSLGEELRIWSNTKLLLDPGATIKYTGPAGYPILRGSHFDENGQPCLETSGSCSHGGYGQCSNVVIRGGTWNRNSAKTDNSNVFIFRHASGIEISDMTVTKCSNHYFNLSGSENVVVSNVVFTSPVKYTGGTAGDDFWGKFTPGDADRYKTIEAIHLDAITKGGEPNCQPRDGTPCRNVQVVDCDFVGVFAGVGTHHVAKDAVPESPRATGIEVRDCTFESLQSFAVYCFGYENARIEDNAVVGGAGLLIVEDSTCTATGNAASGGNHNTIQVGNGSTATITGNTLENAGMAAVRVIGGSTAVVKKNTIKTPATMGLSAAEGSVLKASGNTITGAKQHGVYVNAATAALASNKIVSPVQAGIRGDAKAKITASSNTISGAGTYGITLGGASKLVATGNTIKSPKKYGIILDSCAASTVSDNTITGAGSVAIRLNKTKGSTVSGNTVTTTAATCDGILLDTCATGTVSGNTVTKTGGFGIRILGTKSVPATVSVTGNTVSTGAAAKGYADIRLGDWCQKCKVAGNYLANKKYTVSSTGTTGNKYAPAATKLASLVRSTDAKMAATWKKQKYAAGYQLQWADNKSFAGAKTATVSGAATVSKAIGSLSKKKRYWVRIRTYDKISGKTCYSAWSPALAALPSWAMGTFTGYAVVKGQPGTATMKIANTGAVSGSLSIGGSVAKFSAADLTSWDGKKFTVKFAVTVGAKTWKPTYAISAATGAQTIGIAKISVANYVSEMSQNLSLLSASGKLAPLVGKSWKLTSATAGAGLGEGDALTIKLAAGDKLSWSGTIGGVAVSGSSPCAMRTATASGTSVVYAAKVPICIPSANYYRLAVCKATRTKAGACSAKWSFGDF